ncbi:hypothetical protein AKO1_015297 [Acrasis kona]|uniref:Transmembrane protein 135 N-terminal domain-containing protein n=1 Tax=Acrasis kona TaxID=1008807 RepID=A0AAW2ZF26_9EUKA
MATQVKTDDERLREHGDRIKHTVVRDQELFPLNKGCQSKNVYFTREEERALNRGKNHYIQCDYLHPNQTCESVAATLWLKEIPAAFMLYAPIHLIPVLVYKRKSLFKDPIPILTGFFKNSMRSALFLAVFNSVLVYGMCKIGKLRQRHGIVNVYLAGLFAGASLFFEPKGRRSEIAIYSVVETSEAARNSIIQHKFVSEKNMNRAFIALFSLAMATTMYLYEHNTRSLKSSVVGLLRKIVGTN